MCNAIIVWNLINFSDLWHLGTIDSVKKYLLTLINIYRNYITKLVFRYLIFSPLFKNVHSDLSEDVPSIATTPLPPSINTSAIVYSNGIDLFNLFDESDTINGNGISVTGIVIIVLLSLICVILTAVSKISKTLFVLDHLLSFFTLRLRSI